jgi:hypothetical protein
LKGTRDEGLLLDPKEHSFQVVADADHSGNWKVDQSANDEATAKSRTGYVIKHAGCPVVWHSKLQTEIALSSIEAEHVCLRESLRDTVPMMQLIKEIQDCGFKVPTATPVVQCRLLTTIWTKLRPRTKHMNLKHHHFRSFVRRSLITIHHVGTLEQSADVMTKPLGEEDFKRHRCA